MEESDECRMRIDALIPRYCDLIFFEVGTDDCMCDNAGIATAASICFCVDIRGKVRDNGTYVERGRNFVE